MNSRKVVREDLLAERDNVFQTLAQATGGASATSEAATPPPPGDAGEAEGAPPVVVYGDFLRWWCPVEAAPYYECLSSRRKPFGGSDQSDVSFSGNDTYKITWCVTRLCVSLIPLPILCSLRGGCRNRFELIGLAHSA